MGGGIDIKLTLKERKAWCLLIEAVGRYADPEFYHAILVIPDRPAGGFADDFGRHAKEEFYKRPMPGKLARKTMKRVSKLLGIDDDHPSMIKAMEEEARQERERDSK